MDEEQGLPVRFSDILLRHVLSDAVEHLPGVRRDTEPESGCHPIVDLQAALELGLPRHALPPWRGAVRLWILQRNADLYGPGPHHHDAV